jgi:hypothetical protein
LNLISGVRGTAPFHSYSHHSVDGELRHAREAWWKTLDDQAKLAIENLKSQITVN